MINVGFIGAGRVATWHLRCMKQCVPEAKVAGICDLDPDRARTVAAEFGIPSFPSSEALLSSALDAVFICTPPKAHKDAVIEAINARKHVFCEKPLAATYSDGLEITRAIEGSDCRFMTGYLFHHCETVRRMKTLLDNGDLGDLALAWSVRLQPHVPAPGAWSEDPVGGGILDFCSHDIELLAWLGGQPAAVTAHAASIHPGLDCMDTVSIALHFSTGIGSVVSSLAAQTSVMNLGATGTKGTITLTQDGPGMALASVIKLAGQEEVRGAREELVTVMAAEQRAFIQSVETGAVISPGIREALDTLKIQQAIENSWQTGKTVRLDST